MTDAKGKIMDIAMNLSRVGNWAADSYMQKRSRISIFLDQTSVYIKSLGNPDFPEPLKRAFELFLKDYPQLETEGKLGPTDTQKWAEQMLTWGTILTHRAQLIIS